MENNNPDTFFIVKIGSEHMRKRTKWGKEEENYLERRYLLQPVEKTAKKLNRTTESVKHKAARMGLNHYTNSFNAKTISNCFNIDMRVVKRWVEKFDLPCKKVICSNQTRYLIEAETFWEWAKTHKDIINWTKYNSKSICPEPPWLKDELANYSTPRSRARYTQQEIITIKNMLHRGLSYREIAEEMGRSYHAINHLCRKIYT